MKHVKHVELYSCKDISYCESDSVLRELSLIAIHLFLATAPLNFSFFFSGGLASGFQCLGVDVLPGVTSFLSTFIAPKAIVVLIDSRSIESMSNVLSYNKSTTVMSLDTSATILYTSFGFGICENDLK